MYVSGLSADVNKSILNYVFWATGLLAAAEIGLQIVLCVVLEVVCFMVVI